MSQPTKRSGATTMLMHIRDHHRDQDRDHSPLCLQGPRSYSAVMPAHVLDEQGRLIDQLIHFAFDTLGAQHLDLRVYEAE